MVTANKKKRNDEYSEWKQSLMSCFCEAKQVLSGKTVDFYDARALVEFIGNARQLMLELHYARKTRRRADWTEMRQHLQDLFDDLDRKVKGSNVRLKLKSLPMDHVANKIPA